MMRRCALVVCLVSLAVGRLGDRVSAAAGPQLVSVSPSSGSGAGRTFTFVYSHPDGVASIATVEALIASGTDLTDANRCYFFGSGDRLWLRDEARDTWMDPVTTGRRDILYQPQCVLAAAAASLSTSADSLSMTVPVTFGISFVGPKTIYTKATDRSGNSSGWVRGATFTVAPLNPQLDVVTSACADPARDNDAAIEYRSEQGGKVQALVTRPACFPSYGAYLPQEGYFLEGDRRPLPIMGRTSGHFDVLAVFVDTDSNRRKLYENPSMPSSVRSKIADGLMPEALTELFASYTPAAVATAYIGKGAETAFDFSFAVATTRLPRADLELVDGGLGFAHHDAVLVIDDLAPNAGHGVRRWPAGGRPLFHGRDGGFFFHLDPFWLTPGLFGRELLQRNVPSLLKEYQFGETTLVNEGGVVYDRTPIINPRTGENIEPLVRASAGKIPIGQYLAGFADVDGDGIIDCIDPYIAPTPDNVDGDFIPDRFDPDLGVDHRPYTWMYAARGVFDASARGSLGPFRRPGR